MSNGHVQFAVGTFSIAGSASFPGLVVAPKVAALHGLKHRLPNEDLIGAHSTLSLLENWDKNFRVLQQAADLLSLDDVANDFSVPVDQLTVHPPIELPRQIFCCGANYRKHVIDLITDQGGPDTEGMSKEERRVYVTRQMDERASKGSPYFFLKAPSAVTGPYDPIILPRNAQKPDWELELAVVMGRAARHVRREEVFQYVAGFTIGNDLSNRDLIARPELKGLGADWVRGKCMPTYLPLGPFIVPTPFVGNVQALQITLKLNGEVMQNESTSDMIFSVAQQIEYLSSYIQLWPGDVILTGSPAGNGTHFNRFLQPKDVVESSITGLGTQRNVCVAEAA